MTSIIFKCIINVSQRGNLEHDTRQRHSLYDCTCCFRFPYSNFRYYLTLFSKFFGSFPHSTCLLLVYHKYLALDGVYYPIRNAIPNISTSIMQQHKRPHQARTGVSPSMLNFSKKLGFKGCNSWYTLNHNSVNIDSPIFKLSLSHFSRP